MAAMKYETVKVADLSNDPANARKHGEKNIATIVASLRRFGQQKPIVVDSSGVVRAGNGTLEAAKHLGWDTIEIQRTELTSSDAIAYAIADNRTSELAEWDDDILAAQLQGLLTEDEALLDAAGFDEDELAALLDELTGDGTTGSDGGGSGEPSTSSLADRFGVVPFSVLNAREGWWQDRKRAWLALGIKSELGRGEHGTAAPGGGRKASL
jgi:hypothetical protein